MRRAGPPVRPVGRRGRPSAAPHELALSDAQLVGAWGLGITWDDGHSTGIYPFESLHAWIEAGHPVLTPDSGPGSLSGARLLAPGRAVEALSLEAHEVGRRAAERLAVREDSWLIGTSREFSRELGGRGWLGMTWPTDEGGAAGRRLERFVVFEALIAEGAPIATSWFADRQIGPTLLQFGTPSSVGVGCPTSSRAPRRGASA